MAPRLYLSTLLWLFWLYVGCCGPYGCMHTVASCASMWPLWLYARCCGPYGCRRTWLYLRAYASTCLYLASYGSHPLVPLAQHHALCLLPSILV